MRYDASNTPGNADWSPSSSDLSALGLAEIAVQQNPPGTATQNVPIPVVPGPPSPSIGGQTGVPLNLGWTEGMRPSRSMAVRFSGETLVVPHQGPHPVYNSMGNFDRQTVAAYPAMKSVAVSRKRSPLAEHLADLFGGGGNG